MKIVLEKKKTALIPLNCWASITTQAMIKGILMAALVNISESVTCGTSFMASYSALMSSNSSCTSTVPLSQFKAKKTEKIKI